MACGSSGKHTLDTLRCATLSHQWHAPAASDPLFPARRARCRSYLKEEHLNKQGTDVDLSDWEDVCWTGDDIPLQDNSYDCGVFMCQFASTIVRNVAINFTSASMPYIRCATLARGRWAPQRSSSARVLRPLAVWVGVAWWWRLCNMILETTKTWPDECLSAVLLLPIAHAAAGQDDWARVDQLAALVRDERAARRCARAWPPLLAAWGPQGCAHAPWLASQCSAPGQWSAARRVRPAVYARSPVRCPGVMARCTARRSGGRRRRTRTRIMRTGWRPFHRVGATKRSAPFGRAAFALAEVYGRQQLCLSPCAPQ